MARGGKRTPRKPAAVSGPGALSARTDGGPGQMGVGLGYGENKAVNDLQSAAPVQSTGGGGQSAPRSGRGTSPMPQNGIFGPTDRPGEPLTAGIDYGPGPGAERQMLDDDPYLIARALLQVAPSPQLERLVARLARG